jgi:integration host factor subunit beta
MTKRDIANTVSTETGLPQDQSLTAVQATLNAMADALADGQTIELRGFGVFEIQERKPKVGNNPRTGERVEIPARRVVKFRATSQLRDRVATAEQEAATIATGSILTA